MVEVMEIRCRHCGSVNEIGPFEVDAECASCRTVLLEGESGDPAPRGPPPAGELQIGPLSADLSAPLEHESQALGEMPAGSEGALDLTAILGPTPVPTGVQAPIGAPDSGPGFSFDAHGELGSAASSRSAAPAPGARHSGWRIRSERGLVYELMTVDAVAAWLEGKDDIEGVRIARGDGDFVAVRDEPEIARRLGLAVPVPATPATPAGPALALADDGPRRRRTVAAAPAALRPKATGAQAMKSSPTRTTGEGRGRGKGSGTTARAPIDDRRTVGLGLVLWITVVGALLCGAAVLGGLQAGLLTMPPPLEAAASESAPPPPLVSQALEALAAGRSSAAALLLKRAAAAKDADPTVFRHLARALHRAGRTRDAREALAEYRRRMARRGR